MTNQLVIARLQTPPTCPFVVLPSTCVQTARQQFPAGEHTLVRVIFAIPPSRGYTVEERVFLSVRFLLAILGFIRERTADAAAFVSATTTGQFTVHTASSL